MTRRLTAALAALVLLVLCLCPAACAAENGSGRIGIISAMPVEVSLLLENAQIDHTDTVGGMDFHVGTLCGREVVIVQAGEGKVLSSAGAAVLLSRYPVDSLIFTGIAGGVGDETRVLDVVIASDLVQHDYGTRHQDGFEWRPAGGSTDGYFYCDEQLVASAWQAAVETVGEGHVFKGLIATGDQFIASESYVAFLQDWFGAMACEMEGASVAAVCGNYGIPFVIIRTMSDKADGNARKSISNMRTRAADNSCRIVMRMLAQPDSPEAEVPAAPEPQAADTEYAQALFDAGVVHRIDIRIDGADWSALSADAAGAPYPADVVIDGEEVAGTALSAAGTGWADSRGNCFRVDFGGITAGQAFHGLDALVLKSLAGDPTYMKEFLSFEIFRKAGVETPLSCYVWLTVNGRGQGLYLAEEDTGGSFVNRAWEGRGRLYAVGSSADLAYAGERIDRYPALFRNAGSVAEIKACRRVIAALRALHSGTGLADHLDTDRIIRYFAAQSLMLNDDSCPDIDPEDPVLCELDGKLSLVPRNCGHSFGTCPAGSAGQIPEDPAVLMNTGIDTPLTGDTAPERLLWQWIPDSEEYLAQYHGVLDDLIKEYVESGELDRTVNRLYTMLLPYVQRVPTSFFSVRDFRKGCRTLKAFCNRRAEIISRQLSGALSTVTGDQEPGSRVDVSDISLRRMGIPDAVPPESGGGAQP